MSTVVIKCHTLPPPSDDYVINGPPPTKSQSFRRFDGEHFPTYFVRGPLLDRRQIFKSGLSSNFQNDEKLSSAFARIFPATVLHFLNYES